MNDGNLKDLHLQEALEGLTAAAAFITAMVVEGEELPSKFASKAHDLAQLIVDQISIARSKLN